MRAVHSASYPLGSADSLATMSANTSFSDFNGLDASDDAISMKIFNAVQDLTLNSYVSSTNLAALEGSKAGTQRNVSFVMFFLKALEDFNALVPVEEGADAEGRSGMQKFC